MADFISFNEGRKYLMTTAQGLPTTCYFLISTRDCNTHAVGDTLAGGVGEITGTGYARTSEAAPTPTLANPSATVFAQKQWDNATATDWSNTAKSVVMATTSNNTGKAICAWNLVTGGTARDLSAAHTILNFTPTLNLA